MTFEVNKYNEAEIFQGYVVLLLVDTLRKFQFFVTIFAHSATPISEVFL